MGQEGSGGASGGSLGGPVGPGGPGGMFIDTPSKTWAKTFQVHCTITDPHQTIYQTLIRP